MNARIVRAIAGYAVADMRAEWVVTVLTVLLYGLLMTPLLMLHVVKTSVIAAWAEDLARDNRNSEVRIIGEYKIDPNSLTAMQALPSVRFVVPEASYVVQDFRGRRVEPERGRQVSMNMRTTAPGDPAFPAEAPRPTGFEEIALSVAAATKLGERSDVPIKVGDTIALQIKRPRDDGGTDVQRPEVRVVAIVPQNRWGGGGVFVSTDLARAIEEFRWHVVDPGPGWPDAVARPDAPWKSVRIYARSVRDAVTASDAIAALSDAEGKNFNTEINTDEIINMVQLETGLSRIFNVIVALSAVGFGATAFLTQWVSVSRKRRDLALMVMAGFRRTHVWMFPMTQSAVSTLGGGVMALTALVLAGPMIRDFVATYSREGTFYLPPLWHFGAAFAIALSIAIAASWGAVRQFRELDIAASLRSD